MWISIRPSITPIGPLKLSPRAWGPLTARNHKALTTSVVGLRLQQAAIAAARAADSLSLMSRAMVQLAPSESDLASCLIPSRRMRSFSE